MIVTLDSIPFLVVVVAVVSLVYLSFLTKLRDCAQRFRFLALLFSALKEGPRTGMVEKKKKNKWARDWENATRLPEEIGRLPFVRGKKLMRGYARLDSDRPFIRRQSILVLSAVDSMLSESSVPSPLRRQMAIADVQRASGRVYEIRYTCSGEAPSPAPRHITCVLRHCIYAFLYTVYFYVHRMMQCTVVLLLLEVIIFCPVAAVTPRHAGSATCLLDEAICCFRVGGCSFGQSGPGDFPLCHEKRF